MSSACVGGPPAWSTRRSVRTRVATGPNRVGDGVYDTDEVVTPLTLTQKDALLKALRADLEAGARHAGRQQSSYLKVDFRPLIFLVRARGGVGEIAGGPAAARRTSARGDHAWLLHGDDPRGKRRGRWGQRGEQRALW
jgi:hypothetical protein